MFFRATVVAVAAALVSFTSLAAGPAGAASAATPRVDQRQAHQESRIDQGVASGQLTARETRRLQRQQHAIDRAETRAKTDGTVTAQERKHLRHLQDAASADIKHQKHDRQQRRHAHPAAGG